MSTETELKEVREEVGDLRERAARLEVTVDNCAEKVDDLTEKVDGLKEQMTQHVQASALQSQSVSANVAVLSTKIEDLSKGLLAKPAQTSWFVGLFENGLSMKAIVGIGAAAVTALISALGIGTTTLGIVVKAVVDEVVVEVLDEHEQEHQDTKPAVEETPPGAQE